MKKNYFFVILFLLFGISIFGQVTVKIENASYAQGGSISSTIEVYEKFNTRILFEVSLKRPSGQAVSGYLQIYIKKSSNDSPKAIGQSQYISNSSWSTSYRTSKDLKLYPGDFNMTGGLLYAEFKSQSGISYKSATKDIRIVDEPKSSGGSDSVDLNLNNIVYGAFEVNGNSSLQDNLVIQSDSNSKISISGNELSFGTTRDWFLNKQYAVYTWSRKIDKIVYTRSNRGSSYKIVEPGRWQYLTNNYPRYDFRNNDYKETLDIQEGYLYSYKRYVTGTLQSTNKRVRISSDGIITVRKKSTPRTGGTGGGRSGTKSTRLQSSLNPTFNFVTEENTNLTLNLYPNPSSNFLSLVSSIDLSNSNIIIYDLSGRTIFSKKLLNSKEKINVEFIPKGNYIISVDTKSGKFSKHFTKN